MSTIILNSSQQYDSDRGETLLDAATRAGITVAYSCRTGRCSTCKCKVVRGDSVALHEELGLTDADKDNRWILSCVRTATTDMVLEVDDLGGLVLLPIMTLPSRIETLEKLAPDVIKVLLRLPPTSDFWFHPGQYINVIGHGGLRRSYSLANASASDKRLELHIRAVPGGAMSEYWFCHAMVNDLLRLNGPLGTFFLRNVAGLDLVFLATGTGISPVKAMLEGINELPVASRPRSIAVYWGGRTPSDLYYDLSSVGAEHRYVPVLSRAGANWTGARGYVQHSMLADRPNVMETVVYACGSDAMIHSARDLLLNFGLPERRFLSDAFVCSAAIEL